MELTSKMKVTSNMKTTSKIGLPPNYFAPPPLPFKSYLKFVWWLLTLAATRQLTSNRICYHVSNREMEFHMIDIIYAALSMCAQTEKTTFSCKDDWPELTQPLLCLFKSLLGKVGGWYLVCWLHSQIYDQPRCYGRAVTIPRMVTVPLQPFLLYMNFALKNTYRTGIWLSNIIKHCKGGHLGGWACQRQHICCSRKIMDGWAELCHTQK